MEQHLTPEEQAGLKTKRELVEEDRTERDLLEKTSRFLLNAEVSKRDYRLATSRRIGADMVLVVDDFEALQQIARAAMDWFDVKAETLPSEPGPLPYIVTYDDEAESIRKALRTFLLEGRRP